MIGDAEHVAESLVHFGEASRRVAHAIPMGDHETMLLNRFSLSLSFCSAITPAGYAMMHIRMPVI